MGLAVRVYKFLIKPTMCFRPGLVAFPLRASSDMEIMLLANVISLTPGTLGWMFPRIERPFVPPCMLRTGGSTRRDSRRVRKTAIKAVR